MRKTTYWLFILLTAKALMLLNGCASRRQSLELGVEEFRPELSVEEFRQSIQHLPLIERQELWIERREAQVQRQQQQNQQIERRREQERQQQARQARRACPERRARRASTWSGLVTAYSTALSQQPQQAPQQRVVQNTPAQTQSRQASQPQQTVANSSQRENDARAIQNEGARLAQQTSDINRANAIRSEANSLANRIRRGEITLAQAQSTLRGINTQQQSVPQNQSIQTSGWYYFTSGTGAGARTMRRTVRLTVQRRETGGVHPIFLILSIDGRRPPQTIIAHRDGSTGLFFFNEQDTGRRIFFNP